MASSEKRFRNCVGPGLRRLRMARELTQDQLAAKLQLAGLATWDRVAVAKVESRIRSVFDFELAVICEVLGVAASELLPPSRVLRRELDDLLRGRKD